MEGMKWFLDKKWHRQHHLLQWCELPWGSRDQQATNKKAFAMTWMRDYQDGSTGWGPVVRFWICEKQNQQDLLLVLIVGCDRRELRVTLRFERKDQDFNFGHGIFRYCEVKISPAISINKKSHSHRWFLASKREWKLPKLWSIECCHPPRWLLWSWGSLRSSHLPFLKVTKETGLAKDSWGAYERNEFSEPRGLHLPKHRVIIP